MSLIKLGLALLLLVVTVSQLLQPVQARSRVCGESLIRELESICRNGFARRLRRSTVPKDRVRTLLRKLQRPEEDSETERERETEMAKKPPVEGRGRRLKRHRRRIAHECCKEGCTYEDMLDYCA
ncbi:probable insulin-like peptide 4 [Drosophila eugracilis]|uniref:probable insulin-like peptide 4 n=1 Tax=Drosophila eugracilis TaxID=29029 RepID=UPI0007E6E93C|nr:probable insulin-like peptide 4 [Drosophila eugracilis]